MEASIEKLLITPVPKAESDLKHNYPFPIIRSDCEQGKPDPSWRVAVGFLQQDCVLVRDDESIKLLYTQGFYGKGNQSKNAPKVCLEDKCNKGAKGYRDVPGPSIEKSKEIIDIVDDNMEKMKKDIKPKHPQKNKVEEIIISSSSDSDSSDSGPSHSDPSRSAPSTSGLGSAPSTSGLGSAPSTSGLGSAASFSTPSGSAPKEQILEGNPIVERESLQLTFEEAYFLSYGFGCLVVKDKKGQPIDLGRLWCLFCESTPDAMFPVMYTAYHHFRSKGWVVKSGVKYGTDYLLYKEGPPFYHATYSVIVKHVKEENFKSVKGNRDMTWATLLALQRLNSSASKGLLFLYVIKPTNMSNNKISTPFCIQHYKVEEVLFQRWVAAENRE